MKFPLVWLSPVSDVLAGLAYLSIPAGLWLYARRSEHSWPVAYTAVAVCACATAIAYFVSAWGMFHAAYGLEAIVKPAAALITLVTLFAVLWLPLLRSRSSRATPKLPLLAQDLVAEPVESHPEPGPLTTKVALRDPHGEILAKLDVNRDITERRKRDDLAHRLNSELEQRVAERTAQLEAANKELESFSYSVSHDLRAPLRSIDGFSQALLEDYSERLDDTGRDHLRRVRGASQRMASLIDDLLSLSRFSRGEMHRVTVDLAAVARRIVSDLRKEQAGRDVEFRVPRKIEARADASLIYAVLDNLLRNAWKFTERRAHAKIELLTSLQGNLRCYCVRDNGVGFDMAYADKLFGAFQRLHSTSDFPGTGIGLATVQRIVHRHGGRVWAEAVPGEGATFCFTLGDGDGAALSEGDAAHGRPAAGDAPEA